MSIMYMKKQERTGTSVIRVNTDNEEVFKLQGYAKCDEKEYVEKKAAK